MKAPTVALLAVVFCLVGPAAAAAPPHGDSLIVPGRRIGVIGLGPNGRRALAKLPKPDRADAGMSQTHLLWISQKPGGRRETLFLHTTSNGALNVKPLSGVTIDVIRITSPWFHTANGLATGSTLRQIRRRFPHLRTTQGDPTVYDASHLGIAFEFSRKPALHSRCIAIMVHPPGAPAGADARQLRELLQSPPP